MTKRNNQKTIDSIIRNLREERDHAIHKANKTNDNDDKLYWLGIATSCAKDIEILSSKDEGLR